MAGHRTSLEEAARTLEKLGVGTALTARIAALEASGQAAGRQAIERLLEDEGLGADTLSAARTIKALAGQVNVVIHAAGIMLSLPSILDFRDLTPRRELAVTGLV